MIAFLKLLNVQGLVGIAVSLALGIGLAAAKIDARHWHKQADRYEQLYHGEQASHLQTQLNYIEAADQARRADKANLDRVTAEQKAANLKTEQSYEARIAAARADDERLRRLNAGPAANPGRPGTAPVPGVPGPAGGPGSTAPQAGLPQDDALVATEQAIQLDELIRWVKAQVGIDVNGGKP